MEVRIKIRPAAGYNLCLELRSWAAIDTTVFSGLERWRTQEQLPDHEA